VVTPVGSGVGVGVCVGVDVGVGLGVNVGVGVNVAVGVGVSVANRFGISETPQDKLAIARTVMITVKLSKPLFFLIYSSWIYFLNEQTSRLL